MTDDYSNDRHAPGSVRVGDSATGAIETGGDVDWIEVHLQPSRTYRIDLEGTHSGAGTLYDPELLGIYDRRETLLPDSADDDSGTGFNSRLFFTPEHYGQYYVAVGARGNREGTYKLRVEEVGVDDIPAGSAGALGIGTVSTGEIELPGDRDRFEVALQAGRTYRIDIDGSPIAGRHMNGRLYDLRDAGGNLIEGAVRDSGERLFFRAAADGIYTIEVGGATNGARDAGVYALSAIDVTRVDDHPSGRAGALAPGAPLAGELEKPGDVDWFTVRLEAGELAPATAPAPGPGPMRCRSATSTRPARTLIPPGPLSPAPS